MIGCFDVNDNVMGFCGDDYDSEYGSIARFVPNILEKMVVFNAKNDDDGCGADDEASDDNSGNLARIFLNN